MRQAAFRPRMRKNAREGSTSDLIHSISICIARSLGWGQSTPPVIVWCLPLGAGAKRLGNAAEGVSVHNAA